MADQLFIPKNRLDLALMLEKNDFDIHLTVLNIVSVPNLQEDLKPCVNSLVYKIFKSVKKSKKLVDKLEGEWWSVDIPWKIMESQVTSQQTRPSIDFKIDPNSERRKPLDDLQIRSKKIRLDQIGILSSIRNLASLENISVVRYIALLLYIVAIEEIGLKNIANIAWKIYSGEEPEKVNKKVSPEKSTFIA